MMSIPLLARALRLPFTTASVLPFIYGALLSPSPWRSSPFIFGLMAVFFTHLSANVINDYADTRLGADTQDPNHYGFFGGSKVITEGLLSAQQVRRLALLLGAVALVAVALMAAATRRPVVLLVYAGILALGWVYSCPPLKLSYRGLGEMTIGLLFGGATVMGGGFSQSGLLFDASLVLPAITHGALVMAILFANEVPDAATDAAVGKRTIVVRMGAPHGWMAFAVAVSLAMACIVGMVVSRQIRPVGLTALVAMFPAIHAARRLRSSPGSKRKLLSASRAAIGMHAIAAVVLILERVL